MMSESKSDDERVQEVRNDGGLLTGAVLVGGTRLLYEAGKDLYSRFKPEKKLFIQLLDSKYLDKHHVITARFASAHIHGIYIESVFVKNGQPKDIKCFRKNPSEGFSFSMDVFDSEQWAVSYPYLIPPSGTLDVHIKLPEQTESKITKDNGTDLVCTFSLIDKLGDPETASIPIRLRWA